MEKVLYDTDIGSNIDDAVCLAYLLSQPSCELLGITTVSGEPEKRAMIASAICTAAGRDIPIVPGAGNPLFGRQRQPRAVQAEALGRWEHRAEFPKAGAVGFMREKILQNPGQITLLATGPLTNVALLFALEPGIPSLLKRLVLMCGSFRPAAGKARAEWNAVCDPCAAAAVYKAAVPLHRSVGLDVTTRVWMDRAGVSKAFTAGILKPVLDFAGIWFRSADRITFHDPLAAAVVFDDRICTFQSGNVEVGLSGPLVGTTRWHPSAGGPNQVASSVDSDEFFRHFFSVVK